MRLMHMDTVRSWDNRDLASLLTFLNQTKFQENWANDAKDTILKPNEALWFPCGYLPPALPCDGEKSVQKAAVSLLLPTYNKTDFGNNFKSVFVQHSDKAKTWKDSQTPISQFLGIV